MPADTAFLASLTVYPLTRETNIGGFECNPAIDWFLKSVACEHHEGRVTHVTCWMDGASLAGYVTTSVTTVELEGSAQREELGLSTVRMTDGGKCMHSFPALLIGMLGVAKTYGRRGLGELMVKSVIGQAYELSTGAGCRFVTVDSDPTEAAMRLYGKTGFRPVARKGKERSTVWMYFDLGRR